MATSDTGCGSRILPRSSMRAAPKSGNSGMSQIWSRKFTALLPFQQVDFIRQHGFLIAEQRDEDAQPDGGLGHRVDNHENRENLSVDLAEDARKGHQIDVYGVEDQLDGHQNDDDIAAGEHADSADEQQRRAQG